ncbi:phosphoethanolamine transferase [Castellaniella sp.]|uniref:phosphoethanolamine transferase n=1 Tax=Castellaniella sp. TaxID=1955812 RepID=UPI00356AA960
MARWARSPVALAITYLVFAILCAALYRKVHVPIGYSLLTLLVALGFLVRGWRWVTLAFTGLVALLLGLYFYASKLLGHQNPLKLIPDLVAILADTNAGEVAAGLANLGSKYEYLSALFLLGIVLLFGLARRWGARIPAGRWVGPGLLAVSAASMGGLLWADGFLLHRVYAGLCEAQQVYADNLQRIQARARFQWGAEPGYGGQDTVVLVLGETARGDRLGINGYHRDTTPLLARQPDLISFTDAISNAAYTLQSTPVILTRSLAALDGRIYPEKSLITAFKEAGYDTYYVSYLGPRHGGDSAVNLIVNEADHYVHSEPPKGELADLAGLQAVQRILAEDAPRKLIVFKMIGSHFNYQDRYDDRFEVFGPSYRQVPYGSPTAADKPILDNTYDNTILKTDYVLSQLVDALKRTPGRASLSFISDHGTAIFEDGRSLYGGQTPYNYSIPLLFWLKPGYFDDERQASLVDNKDRPVDSTCFLDTVLTLADIRTPLHKGCDLAAGRLTPMTRQVVAGNRLVDYDREIRPASVTLLSDKAMK